MPVQVILEMTDILPTLFKTQSNCSSEINKIPNRKQRKGNAFPWHFHPGDGVKEVCIMHNQNSRTVAFQNWMGAQEFASSRVSSKPISSHVKTRMTSVYLYGQPAQDELISASTYSFFIIYSVNQSFNKYLMSPYYVLVTGRTPNYK